LPEVWFDRVRPKTDVEHPPRDLVTELRADDVAERTHEAGTSASPIRDPGIRKAVFVRTVTLNG